MLVVAASRARTSPSVNDSGGRVTSLALMTLAVTYRWAPCSRLGIPSGRNRRCFASTNLSTTAHSINPTRAQYRRNSTIPVMCAFTVLPVRGFPAGPEALSLSGRCSAMFRRLCKVHLWMRALAPNTSRTAAASALAPSRTTRSAARCRSAESDAREDDHRIRRAHSRFHDADEVPVGARRVLDPRVPSTGCCTVRGRFSWQLLEPRLPVSLYREAPAIAATNPHDAAGLCLQSPLDLHKTSRLEHPVIPDDRFP
jgi:hypothetical protein